MATKSDFAQKLLHDLRLRKERMAATQKSGQQSNHMSTDAYANHRRTYSGAQQIKASQSASSRTGNTTRKSNSGSRAIGIEESSKQIVLANRGQGSRQAGDLSTAIAFALENGGKIKISSSSNNPLVNFFNRFSRRSVDSGKMKLGSFNKHSLSTNQVPTVSHIHITEISKGIQKLNQILRACSNGHNLDRNSIQVGKELLKGAMDLEESLKMLVNMQEASEYMISSKQKNRIKLLDEDEDDEDDDTNIVDKRILDRPRFSFDKHDKNSYVSRGSNENDITQQLMLLTYPTESSKQHLGSSKTAPHKRSASYVPDFDSRSANMKPKNHSSSPQSTQDKGRVSNVIAKLMGLEEIPLKEETKRMQKDSSLKKKEGKVANKNPKPPQQLNRDGKNGSPLSTNKKVIQTNHAPAIKDNKFDFGVEKNRATSNDAVISGKKSLRQDMKIQAVGVDAQSGSKIEMNKQRNHIGEPNKVLGFQNFHESKTEAGLQQKPQQKLGKPEAEVMQEKIESKLSVDHLPKRSADEVLKNNPQELQDKQELHQVSVPEKLDRSEKKSQAGKSGQQLLKLNFQPKNHKGHQVERLIASKPKSKALQKKQPNAKPTPGMRKSIKQLEKVPLKDSPNRRQRDDSIKDHQSQRSSTKELENETEKATSVQVRRNEKHPKIDLVMTKKNGTVKHSTVTLQDVKQQQQNLLREEEEVAIIRRKDSERRAEPLKESVELQTDAEQTPILNNSVRDECQAQSSLDMLASNDNCQDIALKTGKVIGDQPTGVIESGLELCKISQHEYKKSTLREEQLTEPEKHLKEILIKSQSFLNAAETLFKLKFSESFNHAGEVENTKLILDCGYEVMKRKARRQEVTMHHYAKTWITYTKVRSLDDLVKQLCKDFEMLKIYMSTESEEGDIADYLYKMLDRDIHNRDPDVNSVWDFGWEDTMFAFPEKDYIVRDVEKHVLNGLLDEITNDLLIVNVLA